MRRRWSPSALDAGQHSAEFLNSQWSKFTGADQDGFLKDIFAQYGIFDPKYVALYPPTSGRGC